MNKECRVTELLELAPNETVLGVEFGPGVVTQRLSKLSRLIAGVDPSHRWFDKPAPATRKLSIAVASTFGRVLAETLPFHDHKLDRAIAINSMQVWADAAAGLREIRRAMKSDGRIAFGFTPCSGQRSEGLAEMLAVAGFTEAHVTRKDRNFCALAIRP